ncbi:MAG: alpha/beta fold hydrolase [Gammaproteobacteria bacterium]|nr:alpha/beta fold hydrolase [Gammaproteobacteria bacterium]
MAYQEILWHIDGHDIPIGLERLGQGPTLLLLPALSSISTRREMQAVQQHLAQAFTTVSIDWPGFGSLPKPYINWRPALYEDYVNFLLTRIVPQPHAIVAAGHAVGYVLRHFARHPHHGERLIFLSPTWRGPLPTMMNGDRPLFARITRAVDKPVLGNMLYALNVNRFVVGLMARGHVYADPHWLKGQRLQEKLAVTRTPGARHASIRFVTGGLDPFRSRQEQLDNMKHITAPVLNIFAQTAPRKSRQEMETLSQVYNLQTVRLPRGKLSFYEEFPAETAAHINAFLKDRAVA